MTTQVLNSFVRDIRKITGQQVAKQIDEAIISIEKAASIADIPHLIKLSGYTDYYRMRVANYRIGIRYQHGVVTLVRCLDRKEIYKYFP